MAFNFKDPSASGINFNTKNQLVQMPSLSPLEGELMSRHMGIKMPRPSRRGIPEMQPKIKPLERGMRMPGLHMGKLL